MNVGKIGIAYPHVAYEIEVTHHTERKATAPEWLLLKIALVAEKHSEYGLMPLKQLLESVFFISDNEILFRQVLIDLMDANALEYIPRFSDVSDWRLLRCGDLKLTNVGRLLQREGKLPAKTQPNNLSVMYDVVNSRLVETDKNLVDATEYAKVIDIDSDNPFGFPVMAVKDYVDGLKNSSIVTWLQRNSRIDSIEPIGSQIKWKNLVREILAGDDGRLSLKGEPDSRVAEAVLRDFDFGTMPEGDLPILGVGELSKRNPKPYDKAREKILALAEKSRVFFIARDFADIVNELNDKICIVTAENSFNVEASGSNLIVRVPDVQSGLCYRDLSRSIFACAVDFRLGNETVQAPYIYETAGDFSQEFLQVVKARYRSEQRILHRRFYPNALELAAN